MAAYIRNNNPTIFTGIVNENAGLPGGKFVVRTAATNAVALAAANSAWEDVYLTINVKHDYNAIGDDANAIVAKGGLIAMVHPIPTDEVSLNTDVSLSIGDKCTIAANGAIATATSGAKFEVIGIDPVFGKPGVQLRCIA